MRWGDYLSLLSCAILGLISLWLPFYYHFYIRKRVYFDGTQLTLLLEVDQDKLDRTGIYPTLFMVRNHVLALISIFVPISLAQIGISIYLQIIVIGFIYNRKPFSLSSKNFTELVNEVLILVGFDLLIIFTGCLQDGKSQELGGFAFIGLLLMNLTFNISFILRQQYLLAKKMWRIFQFYLSKLFIRVFSKMTPQQKPMTLREEL